jgi:hypothetical protein
MCEFKSKKQKVGGGGDMTRNIFSSQLAQHHSNIRKKWFFFQPFSSLPIFFTTRFFFSFLKFFL